MYGIIHYIVLATHILLGIMWVGGILFVGWAVFPVTNKMDYSSRQSFLVKLMQWVHHRFAAIGIAVIGTGILLGSVLGPVRSLETAFHTSYGQHLTLALVIGVVTLLWGVLVSYKFSMKILKHPVFWKMAKNGYPRLLNNAMRSVSVVSSVEVIGFVALLMIMLTF